MKFQFFFLLILCGIVIGLVYFSTQRSLVQTITNSVDGDRQMRLEEKLRSHRAALEMLSCATRGIGLRGGFCLKEQSLAVGGNYFWDLTLAREIEKIFTDQTVGDFGAGLGWYGKFFLRRSEPVYFFNPSFEEKYFMNITDIQRIMEEEPQRVQSWKGFDGAGNIEELSGGFIQYLDLSEEVYLGKRFDWVLSLEVGEHIPRAYETMFVDNLDRHACKGIVLSWAVEGQGGHHHVNTRNNDYIKNIMEKRGFRNLEEIEKKLRGHVTLDWFRHTVMVFERKEINHPECVS